MNRRRGLWVVGAAKILPGREARLVAETLLRRLEDQGRVHLVASALAEDPGDEGGDRDHVRHLPVLGACRMAQERVLTRHQQWVRADLGDSRVDAGDIVLYVLGDLLARGAI